MKDSIKLFTYKLESSFLLTVVRHGLAMMIPFVLTGGIACALLNLPIPVYQSLVQNTIFEHIFNTIYMGTFGMFSFGMLISLSASYCMERNMSLDKTVICILISLAAFGAQLYIPGGQYNTDMLGVKGCFLAIFTALLSCYLLEKLLKIQVLRLGNQLFGLERITAIAISVLIPAILVISFFVLITQLILFVFDSTSLFDLISIWMCNLFNGIDGEFQKGLLYTALVHINWSIGLHGSHILEPVAQSSFLIGVSGSIFSKSFFDTYVVMGGCGTTICVLFVSMFFFRKTRLHRISRISFFTVIFNLNEILTFGIPIILNPILIIPFIFTPLTAYILAYSATASGLVPPVINETNWATPVLFSGYMATGSIKGSILQIIIICIGMAIYYPFLKLNLRAQERYAKEQMADLIALIQEKEQQNENIYLLNQANRIGQVCRVLKHDLKLAISNDELFLVFQPQVDNENICIGGEALIRWNHPLYGFIYPPLIIYIAKEGGFLENLERLIIDKTVSAIAEVQKACGPNFKISMNLTAKSLLWDIDKCIDEKLAEYNVSASQLWLEITEQDVLSKATTVINKLEDLKAKGHVLMIDDFGMGHTSILYLQSKHFGVVKLDGSLVKGIVNNSTNQEIISSIISLANNLDVNIISEYVEDEPQKDMLLSLGCKWYQGYLFSKPLPLDEFIEYMKNHSK